MQPGSSGRPLWSSWSRIPAPLRSAVVAVTVAAMDASALVGIAVAEMSIHEAPRSVVLSFFAVLVFFVITLSWTRGGSRYVTLRRVGPQLRAVLPALLGSWLLAVASACAFGHADALDPRFLLGSLISTALALTLARWVLARLMGSAWGSRLAPRSLIVGCQSAAAELGCVDGSHLLGFVYDREPVNSPLCWLGGTERVLELLRCGDVDRVLLAETLPARLTTNMLETLANYAIDVSLIIPLSQFPLKYSLPVSPVRLVPVIGHPIGGWRAVLKFIEDYALSIFMVAIMAVPVILIALAIRLESDGPFLFRQRRTGYNGRDFYILKFRTMLHAAADGEGRQQVVAGDERVTRVGALLRKTSLDEVPQVINVLRGEMSFVGPRPHAPGTRAGGRLFHEVLPQYSARHRVKPGLTGLAQVRGLRGATESEETLIRRVKSDIDYIENWSIWLDMTIICKTLVELVRMRNAY